MANVRIGLIDHGIGNIRSVSNALVKLGMTVTLVDQWEQTERQAILILPGVGNFGGVVDALKKKGLFEPLKLYVNSNRPFIGICVGMQLLFGGSSESPDREGFGLLEGQLRHLSELDKSQIVPSIGWKALQTQRNVFDEDPLEMAYFVHSYFVSEIDSSVLVSTYDWHSFPIPAHVSLGLVHGVQFHPEKSRSAGVEFLGSLIRELTK